MEKKRLRISIILEVAILFLIGVLTTGVITNISERNLSNTSVTEQVEQRASELSEEVKQAVYEYPSHDWLIKYWYDHAAELDIEYDADYSKDNETEKKCREFSARYPEYQLKYVTAEKVETMTAEYQKLYAEITYSWLITHVDQIKRAHNIDFLFCVVSNEPYDTQFFLFSGAEEGAIRGTNYEEIYPLGHSVAVSESQQSAMRNALENTSHLADAGIYVDYYTHLCSFDGNAVFLGMTYSLADLRSNVERETLIGTIFAIINQIILSAVCLGLIYFFVLRPLKGIQKNIRIYRQTKDGETVRKNLDEYRLHNEMGDLSEDVSNLAAEIDDYLARIQTITSEKERITTELSLATRIQAHMLPDKFPAFPDRSEFNIYATMDPAKAVGGDFYDFALIDDDHLYMAIADVSGKGVPAALFMMASKIILENNAMSGKTPAQVLTATNETICANNHEEMFVTAWLGILEISTGKLTAASAGHEYPVIKQPNGDFEIFKDRHGFVLGGMAGIKYKDYEIRLEPGAKLFVYTDGVPEATDPDNAMFGTERMVAALNSDNGADPEQLLKDVRKAVDLFAKEAEQFDDLTMMCMEYKGIKAP